MARKKKEFGEGFIYTATNYVYWFFMGNLYFWLCNIPLVFVLLSSLSIKDTAMAEQYGNLLFICLILVGPAATALFSAMGKLVRDKTVSITKDYFKAYKVNFVQSIFLWSIELVIIRILLLDVSIFVSKGYPKFMSIVLYILIAIIVMAGFYMLPIVSRFYLKAKDVVKLSIVYAIKKPHITILNLLSIISIGYIFFKISSFIILFIASLICYLIMSYEAKVLIEIEESLKNN